MSSEKKNKLRTSEDVYGRLKWDTSFTQDDVIIGYKDRFRGMMEVPYVDFTPGGDIPYHRIYYFRNAEGFVWDRDTRLDLIYHSGEPSAQFSEKDIAYREEQMRKALLANAEAEEEKREMADQKARKQLARIRQAARRDGVSASSSYADGLRLPSLSVWVSPSSCSLPCLLACLPAFLFFTRSFIPAFILSFLSFCLFFVSFFRFLLPTQICPLPHPPRLTCCRPPLPPPPLTALTGSHQSPGSPSV